MRKTQYMVWIASGQRYKAVRCSVAGSGSYLPDGMRPKDATPYNSPYLT